MNRNIFERGDLRQLCSFILVREETANTHQTNSYKEQLDNSKESAYKELKRLYNNEAEYFNVMESFDEAFAIHEEVCTEIGMKIGARLILQLLHEDDNLDSENIRK